MKAIGGSEVLNLLHGRMEYPAEYALTPASMHMYEQSIICIILYANLNGYRPRTAGR